MQEDVVKLIKQFIITENHAFLAKINDIRTKHDNFSTVDIVADYLAGNHGDIDPFDILDFAYCYDKREDDDTCLEFNNRLITAENDVKEMVINNLPLFMNNIDDILSIPEHLEIILCEMYGVGAKDNQFYTPKLTLGWLLEILSQEDSFSQKCPFCSGTSYMYSFNGSPLTGIIYCAKFKCIADGCQKPYKYKYDYKDTTYQYGYVHDEESDLYFDSEKMIDKRDFNVGKLMKIVAKHETSQKKCDYPVTLETLIKILKETRSNL